MSNLIFCFVCTQDCPVRASWNKRKKKKKIPICLSLLFCFVIFSLMMTGNKLSKKKRKKKKRNNWFPGSSLLTLLETNQKVTEENDGREKTGNAAVVWGDALYGFLSLSLSSFSNTRPFFLSLRFYLVRILFFLILFWGFYFRFYYFSFFFWVELLLSTILLKEGDSKQNKKAFDFIIKVFFWTG